MVSGFTVLLINFLLEGWCAREITVFQKENHKHEEHQTEQRLKGWTVPLFFLFNRNARFAVSLVLLLGVKLKPA